MDFTYFDAVKARIAGVSTQAELDKLMVEVTKSTTEMQTSVLAAAAPAQAVLDAMPNPANIILLPSVITAVKAIITILAGPSVAAVAASAADGILIVEKTAEVTALLAAKASELSQMPSVP